MPSRNEELPLAVEIQQTAEQLHIMDGLAIAMREPARVLDAVLLSEDVDDARTLLRERFGLSEVQTSAVLDLQFRQASRLDRRKIEERRDEVSAHLEYLRVHDAPPDE
ncbi:DNA gyrase subunit A [Nocardioides stalactiti]|uniref:DNA gyrase subunit A n=1 Tax=Nocardioides stalactiti TaxID=2755356 RepID=UPI001604A185|nr:DNA gyrase subunit A [Nocardioides stalactiti]